MSSKQKPGTHTKQNNSDAEVHTTQWSEVEIRLCAAGSYSNPYTDVEVWADFAHSSGTTVRRPGFWDGADRFVVRFASPVADGTWTWTTHASSKDSGLSGRTGRLRVVGPNAGTNRFLRHGFLRMSPRGRNLVHADGRPMLLAADTAWALPWRATEKQCLTYARDRRKKGFNAALLMSVQPDMRAEGPRDRTADGGFDVGFEDLPQGRLTQMNVSYFQMLDKLSGILVDHEIVPVWQPVFHGYGWKGLGVAGLVVSDQDYARYCRYLVARYGARPAMYLVNADGTGHLSSVRAGGIEIQRWDCYGQPTGNHYCPHATNNAWQEEEWLDFQWCQTGHAGEHIPERVMDMWHNYPPKAVANGEPTYENIGAMGRASGWWQGEEALQNIFAGGTMGAVYGAGSLWNWHIRANETGMADWCSAKGCSWRDALDFEGSVHVGIIARIFEQYPFADMEPRWDYIAGKRGLSVPGIFYAVYVSNGSDLWGISDLVPPRYRVYDPKTGRVVSQGVVGPDRNLSLATDEPRLIMFHR